MARNAGRDRRDARVSAGAGRELVHPAASTAGRARRNAWYLRPGALVAALALALLRRRMRARRRRALRRGLGVAHDPLTSLLGGAPPLRALLGARPRLRLACPPRRRQLGAPDAEQQQPERDQPERLHDGQ